MKPLTSLKVLILLLFMLINSFLFASVPKKITGNLAVNTSFEYNIKDFIILADKQNNSFRISVNKFEFLTIGKSFINAAVGNENVSEVKGSFFIKDKINEKFLIQTIDTSYRYRNDSIVIVGELSNKNKSIKYKFSIKIKDNQTLKFYIQTEDKNVNRLFLTFSSKIDEQFYGMGEQFTHLGLKGYYVPCFISEQGIGRGKQPITTLVNIAAKSGGNEFTTYASFPFFFSSEKYSFSLDNSEYSAFDFREKDSWQVRCFSYKIVGQFFIADNYETIVSQNSQRLGLIRPLPD